MSRAPTDAARAVPHVSGQVRTDRGHVAANIHTDRFLWASTASTSCSRVSTGTRSLLVLKIELPAADQPRTLPESPTRTIDNS